MPQKASERFPTHPSGVAPRDIDPFAPLSYATESGSKKIEDYWNRSTTLFLKKSRDNWLHMETQKCIDLSLFWHCTCFMKKVRVELKKYFLYTVGIGEQKL